MVGFSWPEIQAILAHCLIKTSFTSLESFVLSFFGRFSNHVEEDSLLDYRRLETKGFGFVDLLKLLLKILEQMRWLIEQFDNLI